MDAPPQLTNGHSAAATMQQPPSASSAGPQIRSRITVVCAECKRLKLKCDRRTPCGSCTKRDTVARCTYSPAAAEKVDLHSLNNRLIQVEHAMALITAGQNLPAFQSSYPLAFPTGTSNAQPPVFSSAFVSNSPGSHQHQHHHHYAVPSAHISAHNSFSPSTSDLSSIWLQDLDLSIPSATGSSSTQRPRSFSNAENAGLIKLEPSPIDIELSQPQTNTSVGDDLGQPSRAPSPLKRMRNERHQQQQQRSSAQLLLPALSIYYPLPSIPPPGTSASSSSSAPFPLHPSSASPSSTPPSTSPPSSSVNNGYSSSSHLPAPCTKPQVTQALLALLPLLPACSRLLHNARDVLRIRPIPFESAPGQGWKQFENRCLTLLGGGANKERDKEREKKEREREKAREARRARQIYFGGIPGLQPHVTLDTEMDDVAAAGGRNTAKSNGESEDGTGDDHSLTFFAVMCGVLAIGASIPSSSAPLTTTTDAIKENPAFLYALSQQALGVWDTHTSSTSSGSALTAAEETEKLDYLLACIAGLSYLLFSNSPARVVGAGDAEREGTGGLGLIYPLVGPLSAPAPIINPGILILIRICPCLCAFLLH
ncbi:hypothetical protein HYPSUDRAFT_85475 [Hypholoma sublateritium FD-334 SS-4]|uniref:Zn(2)-C6 fungal-type domain-containing protein n=1 Tax=Hypholoma sublateritium (strain FD-334 SS-4) TaxID=945553 RepID=A0A0D2Q1D7_HYPSF|nr:hypothetical protein HYPSUDRAFT_85475 [Hypholoma sublateritium FD-334 SS-4]